MSREMRPPYSTIFDPESTDEEVIQARRDVIKEIGEAQYGPSSRDFFLDVWRNIEEATLAAYRENDYELYDYMKNNWEIMKLHAEKP